jgi:hypothetical protein
MQMLTQLALCTCLLGIGSEAEPTSPYNHQELEAVQSGQPFSFWVAGHLYGSHGNRKSVYPSSSFLTNTYRFDSGEDSLLMLLGDNFRRPDEVQVRQLQRVLERIPLPVFNAVGNHDKPGTIDFQSAFGTTTYHSFQLGDSRFIVLDTELADGKIEGAQYEFFLAEIQRCLKDEAVKNVFLFAHRLIWCTDHPEMSKIKPYINSAKYLRDDWYVEKIEPHIDLLAKENKSIYWFSGDVGATWSYSLFHWDDPNRPVHYTATGLGDTARDMMLRVHVDAESNVRIEPVSTTDAEAMDIADFGVDHWKEYFAKQPVATTPAPRAPTNVSKKVTVTPLQLVIGAAAIVVLFRTLYWLGSIGWSQYKRFRSKWFPRTD